MTPDQQDLYDKAVALYSTLVSLTDSPRDAAEIICMMHMLLFLNCGVGEATVDGLLAEYNKNFKRNYEEQVAVDKEKMN